MINFKIQSIFITSITIQTINSLVSPYWYQNQHFNKTEDDNFERYRRQSSFLRVERLRESGNSLVSDLFTPYNYEMVKKIS